MKVYLSGPMTGVGDHGHEAFAKVAEQWREHPDTVVFSPAENFGGITHLPREVYMRQDFLNLCQCDAIVLLPGWKTSKGARIEALIAEELNLTFYNPDGTVIDDETQVRTRLEIRRGQATLRSDSAEAAVSNC